MPATLPAGARIKTTRSMSKRRAPVIPGFEDLQNRPVKAKPKHPESDAQIAVIEWRDKPETRAHFPGVQWLHASLNGVRLTRFQRFNAKREGMTKGVSDLTLHASRGGYAGLLIEMKITPNTPEPEQKEYLEAAVAEGYLCRVCWSADEAITLVMWYLDSVYKREDILRSVLTPVDELFAMQFLRESYKPPKGEPLAPETAL